MEPNALKETWRFLAALDHELNGNMRVLDEFLAGSEQVFLDVGRGLRTLSQEATAVVARAEGAAAGRTDSLSDSLETGLAALAEHVDQVRLETEQDQAQLQAIDERARSLESYDQHFSRNACTLRMLSTSIRVENAKKSSDFENVAQETRGLGVRIDTLFRQLMRGSADVHETSSDATRRVRRFLHEQHETSVDILHTLRESHEALVALKADSLLLAEEAQQTMRQLVKTTHDILFSMQVHDRTRQILEHVAEGSRAYSDAFHEKPDAAESEPEQAWLNESAALCRLNRALVGQARQEQAEALGYMSQALTDLGEGVERLAARARGLKPSAGLSPLDRVQGGLTAITNTLATHAEHRQATRRAVSEAVAQVKRMSSSAGEIRKISSELKIVALNAMVKAVGLGEEGHVMNVLAKFVQGVSEEMEGHTQTLAALIGEIAAKGREMESAERTDRQQLLLDGLQTAVAQARKQQQALDTFVVALDKDGLELLAQLRAQAEQLQEQKDEVEHLLIIEENLASLEEDASRRQRPGYFAKPSARMEAMRLAFTMETERRLHGGETEPPPAEASTAAADSEFGQNVELF